MPNGLGSESPYAHYSVPALILWAFGGLVMIMCGLGSWLALQVVTNGGRIVSLETTLREHEWRFQELRSTDSGVQAAIQYQGQRIDDILKERSRECRPDVVKGF